MVSDDIFQRSLTITDNEVIRNDKTYIMSTSTSILRRSGLFNNAQDVRF